MKDKYPCGQSNLNPSPPQCESPQKHLFLRTFAMDSISILFFTTATIYGIASPIAPMTSVVSQSREIRQEGHGSRKSSLVFINHFFIGGQIPTYPSKVLVADLQGIGSAIVKANGIHLVPGSGHRLKIRIGTAGNFPTNASEISLQSFFQGHTTGIVATTGIYG